MTKALDMKEITWLKLYVNSEVDKFSKKFDVEIDQQEIEDICKIVVSLKLPEGVRCLLCNDVVGRRKRNSTAS